MRNRTVTGTWGALGRRLGGVLGAAALVSTMACQPEPPAPLPIVTSAVASPGVAGQLMTIKVRVDRPVDGNANIYLGDATGPAFAKLPYPSSPDACSWGWRPAQVTPLDVGAELTTECRVPDLMVNGSWTVPVTAQAGAVTSTSVQLAFVVTGGTDDLEAPVVTVLTPNQVVPRGGAFTMAYRMEDPHLGPNSGLYPSWFQLTNSFAPWDREFFCEGPDSHFQRTQVSPTVLEVSFDCTVPTVLEPGAYRAWPQNATDVYGRATLIPLTLTVT